MCHTAIGLYSLSISDSFQTYAQKMTQAEKQADLRGVNFNICLTAVYFP